MEIYYNSKLDVTFVTYPKTASSTLREIFFDQDYTTHSPEFIQIRNNTSGPWVKLKTSTNLIDSSSILDSASMIPSSSKVYLLYRDPYLRYVSGVAFTIQNEYDLLLRWVIPQEVKSVSDLDAIPDTWYENFMNQIMILNGGAANLNNIHCGRALHQVLMLKLILGDRAEMLYINDLDDVIRKLYSLSDDFQIPKINAAERNYDLDEIKDAISLATTKKLYRYINNNMLPHDYSDAEVVRSPLWTRYVHYYLRGEKIIFDGLQNSDISDQSRWQCFTDYLNSFEHYYNIYAKAAHTKNADYLIALRWFAADKSPASQELKDDVNSWLKDLILRIYQY